MIMNTWNESDTAGTIGPPPGRSAASVDVDTATVSSAGPGWAPIRPWWRSPRTAHALWPVAVVASVVATDAASKSWARDHAVTDFPTFGGIVQLRHVRNAGTAFGLGDHYPGIIFAAALISTLAVAWWFTKAISTAERLSVAAVLGGALGNLVDRLAEGAVTDWLHVAWYPPTFNLADVAIRIGAVLAVACRMWTYRQARAVPAAIALALGSSPQSGPGAAGKQSRQRRWNRRLSRWSEGPAPEVTSIIRIELSWQETAGHE